MINSHLKSFLRHLSNSLIHVMVVLSFLSTIFTFLLSYALCKVSDINLKFWTVRGPLLLKNHVKKMCGLSWEL